jgi:hypothetical protein
MCYDKLNQRFEEPVALIGHGGFCEGSSHSTWSVLDLLGQLSENQPEVPNSKPAKVAERTGTYGRS